MLRRTILLAAAALALVAVAAPAAASANWTDKHVALKAGENPHVLFEGSAKFTGGIGSVNCKTGVTATLQLTGGTTDAHAKSFTVHEPKSCEVGGLIGTLCGPKSLTAVSLEKDATVAVNVLGKDLSITKIALTNTFGTCLQITLENTVVTGNEVPITAKVDKGTNQTISEVSLTGDLFETIFEESVVVEATLKATPEGRYGFE
jgi:Cu/Zn superoxide dismutase